MLLALTVTIGGWSLSDLGEDAKYAWTAQLTDSYYQARDNLQELPFADLVRLYAARNDLDPALVAAVIQRESAYDPNAVSRAGARGLMQILPSTWRYLNPDSPCPGDHLPPSCGPRCIFDPAANIHVGTKYLRRLLTQFDGDVVLATAAYNAGASAVRRLGREEPAGIPPFRETRQYVRDVLRRWAALREEPREAIVAMELGTLGRLTQNLPAFSAGLWLFFCLWTLRRLPWTLQR
jgi:soluble lytic murein transglycosylase-like protein